MLHIIIHRNYPEPTSKPGNWWNTTTPEDEKPAMFKKQLVERHGESPQHITVVNDVGVYTLTDTFITPFLGDHPESILTAIHARKVPFVCLIGRNATYHSFPILQLRPKQCATPEAIQQELDEQLEELPWAHDVGRLRNIYGEHSLIIHFRDVYYAVGHMTYQYFLEHPIFTYKEE